MAKPKLTYFDMAASRGEECRLAFFIAGVEFEDNRLPREAWPALKPNTPFGSLPILELEGKPTVSQSNAILAHIGRRYGLLPQDDWEAMRHESLLAAVEDLRQAVVRTFGIKDQEELKRLRTELAQGPIRTWGANVERQIVGPFVGGDAISVADIKVYVVTNWFKKGVLDYVPPDVVSDFPKLQTLVEQVAKHPKVVEWYAQKR